MNKTRVGKLALSGVFTALALVLLLLTSTPIATVGTAALAAVCGIPVVAEAGRRAGWIHFAAVTALAWLLAPAAEGNGMYTVFLGWYTVFKAWLEQKHLPRPAEWGIKYGALAVAMAVGVAGSVFLLQIPLPAWDWVIPAAVLLLCAIFAVYDRCLTGLVGMYLTRLQPSLRKIFKM
ncbi:MAG: hypothetical protein IJN76_01450 [Clostridia bacterium]|nr:hypothetical protein [Clostridia bacterium]